VSAPQTTNATDRQTRRNWLAATGAGLGVILGSGWSGLPGVGRRSAARADSTAAAIRKRALRVAHLTDVHVQPERGGGRGLAQCLRHVNGLADRPELILNTGDSIFDSFRRDRARTELQWELWRKVLADENGLPVHHCIGNHDIWGWDKRRSKTTGNEPGWGKARALDGFGLAKPYHSFDRGGWHFVMLDSVVPFDERHYRARLDDEQFAWLEADLAGVAKGTPVCVSSHIPIFSPAGVINSSKEAAEAPGSVVASGGALHLDVKRIHELFAKAGNVKVCLSGHLHLIDRAEYAGVTYLTNPAVSGNWWKPEPHQGRYGEMYSVLDLFDDGTFAVEHVDYGWTPVIDPKPTPEAAVPGTQPAGGATTRPTSLPAADPVPSANH